MALSSAKHILTKYPLVKGMLAYTITWPTGNIIQQTIDGKRWGKDFVLHYTIPCTKYSYIDKNSFHLQKHTIGINAFDLHYTVHFMLLHHYMAGLKSHQKSGQSQIFERQ